MSTLSEKDERGILKRHLHVLHFALAQSDLGVCIKF